MGSFSIWHWFVVFLFILLPNLLAIPAIRKSGFSGWWVIPLMIPVVGMIVTWIFAFSKWPNYPDR